jgi:hypothetical protein
MVLVGVNVLVGVAVFVGVIVGVVVCVGVGVGVGGIINLVPPDILNEGAVALTLLPYIVIV